LIDYIVPIVPIQQLAVMGNKLVVFITV